MPANRILIIVAASFVFTSPAAADTMDVLLHNTLTLTDADGGVTTVLFSEGGKFEQTNTRGMWAAGFWEKEEGRLCITARGEAKLCMPLTTDKAVGDRWEISGPTGAVVWIAQIREGLAKLGPAASRGE
jgi:hypothetical protein